MHTCVIYTGPLQVKNDSKVYLCREVEYEHKTLFALQSDV